MAMLEVIEYRTADGAVPFARWIERLADDRARARILARIDRMRAGLRGDWKSVGGGGDKRTQNRDIEVAHAYWKDHQERSGKQAVSSGRLPPR